MCAIMDFDITNTEKIAFYTEEVKKMGFKVLPPDINHSNALFKVENGNIRFALAGIKGVGEANMNAIVEEREKNGVFKSVSDFIHRTDIKQINRKQLEQLIHAGAFDCLDKNRGKLFANIDNILRHIATDSETKASSQTSLFGTEELNSEVKLADKPDFPELERLQNEADAIGFYLSAHPLDVYADSMERLGVKSYSEVIKGIRLGDKIMVNLAGCMQAFQKRLSKSGNPFAFVKLTDTSAAYEGVIFKDGLSKYEDALKSGLPLFIQAKIEKTDEELPPKMMINTVKTLDEAITENSRGLIIEISDVAAVRPLKNLLIHEHYGPNKIFIKPMLDEWDVRMELKNGYALDNGNLLTAIRAIAGVSLVKEL